MLTINSNVHFLPVYPKPLIDFCGKLGYDIPRFCYHENLKIAGNCRMCLIEDSKALKPIISCAMSITPSLNLITSSHDFFTNTIKVKKSRESVMEFLLINHPLDCPICDQGGECDLQDLSLLYGSDLGRFYDYKKNTENKNLGYVVKTSMNRCILCTRCVRFAVDVASIKNFGLTGRGSKMEIGSYLENIIKNELSGNIVDICPVGALTLKAYSFLARPWETKKVWSFVFFEDAAQFIRLDTKENEILRILPSKDKNKNLWITNRIRFSYQGVKNNRLSYLTVLSHETTWANFLSIFTNAIIFSQKLFLSNKFVTLAVQDLLSVHDFLTFRRFFNSTSASFCHSTYKNLTCIEFLSNDYQIFKSSMFTKLILFIGLDIVNHASVLFSVLKNLPDLIVISWRSNTPYFLNSIKIINSKIGLSRFFRAKIWETFVWLQTCFLLCVTNYFLKFNVIFFNSLKFLSSNKRIRLFTLDFFDSSTLRTAALLVNTKANAYLNNMIYPILSYKVETQATDNSIFNILQSSHKNRSTYDFILPSSTIYEQAEIPFFDENYIIYRTNKIFSSRSSKTHSNIINASLKILIPENKLYRGNFYSLFNYFSKNIRTPNLFFLQKSFLTFDLFINKSEIWHYNFYSLTKNSSIFLENLKLEKNTIFNIYI